MHNFTHLHVHTEYSLLDGAARIPALVKRAKELGYDSLAITDHGVMYGVIDFYEECNKAGIKPVLGCEIYVAPASRFDKTPGPQSTYNHLILLCENNIGYKNLIKIVSKAFTEGLYYKPRADMELLREYHEGLIASSACLGGEIPQLILAGDYEGACRKAIEFQELFGKNNFYLELQSAKIEEQILVNKALMKMSAETGIPLVATNDVHYINQEDARTQDVLMCIQTGKKLADTDRMRFETVDYYLKSPEEMNAAFSMCPESLENAYKIAQRCKVELEFGRPILPDFGLPEGFTAGQYLRKLCYEGAEERYPEGISDTVCTRLEYELGVIDKMGYSEYYLIVWDFIKYAKDNGITVGPGRGSGAGSLVAYCLKITNIDSLKYNLAFERFLNPERISMPDFDVDFSDERRKEVIDYVIRKYGEDKVAQIVTFGTMAARGAVRDCGRVLDIPYSRVDEIAKMIPMAQGKTVTIRECLDNVPELKKEYDSDPVIKDLIDTSMKLEGMPRNCSTHAAGVVLTKYPVTDCVPVHKNGESVATQFPMTILEKMGLLKVDFLGLRTLTVIQEALTMIKKNHGVDVNFDKMEMNDKAVYKMISDGYTLGVFQLESPGMTRFLTELCPDSLEDIIAGIALYRPGPMDQIPTYIENKKHPGNIKYDHPLLEPILNVTYGCMVYQEQVMQIVRDLAGYTMGQSDLVRRAMAKKKHDVMAKERVNFIEGAKKKGISEEISNGIFDKMTDFASYAFNKAHAACYAVVAYETAWLKKYYPEELMAATMSSFINNPGKIAIYVSECRRMNIKVLPPDVNSSEEKFSVHDGVIYYALGALKNVGIRAVTELVAEREKNGYFTNFDDFCERMASTELNKRCVESMIKAGAFGKMGYTRRSLIESYELIIDKTMSRTFRKNVGQMSLFDMDKSDEKEKTKTDSVPDRPEFDQSELLSFEKEILGIYFTGHPLQKYEKVVENVCNIKSVDLEKTDSDDNSGGNSVISDHMPVTVAGIVTSCRKKMTKNGHMMANVTLEDLYGSLELLVFPKIFDKYGMLLKEDSIVVVEGKVNLKEDENATVLPDIIYGIDDYIASHGTSAETPRQHKNPTVYIDKKGLPRIIAFASFFQGNTLVEFRDSAARDTVLYEGHLRIDERVKEELRLLCRDIRKS